MVKPSMYARIVAKAHSYNPHNTKRLGRKYKALKKIDKSYDPIEHLSKWKPKKTK